MKGLRNFMNLNSELPTSNSELQLKSQIALADVLILQKLLAGPVHHHRAVLQNITPVGEHERVKDILLH